MALEQPIGVVSVKRRRYGPIRFQLEALVSEVCVLYKVVFNAIFLNCTPFNPATIIAESEALIGSEDF